MEKKFSRQDNKVVVISGGAGYLGNFIVKKLAKSGFTIVVIGRSGKKNNADFINNNVVHYIKADITNESAIWKAAEEVKKKFETVFAIIHATSGRIIRRSVLELSYGEFKSQFGVNVFGAFNLFKNFYSIISDDGVVIGITSRAIDIGVPPSSSGSYIPAKYGLKGLLRVLSAELKKRSIRVYAVAPAFMQGGLNDDIPKSVTEFIRKKSQPGEITEPGDVADLILSLLNKEVDIESGKSIAVPTRVISDL
ncbi:MAG: SDR family oxidoreductase [bacterium]|nr:SDR family oxidoreductase [bacterium]